ncbi:MAG: hypothetical protein ACOX05_05780 [Bacillota bacterium]|jgi:hypothetical protein
MMKYDYTIAKEVDKTVFDAQCKVIEKAFTVKKDLLEDVDGSLIAVYITANNEKIDIYMDTLVDAVYVKSTYPLDDLLIKH